MSGPLPELIDVLRNAAKAPRANWHQFAFAIDQQPRVLTSEGGAAAAVLATSARSLVRQLPHSHEGCEALWRSLLITVSDVLAIELNHAVPKPFYADRD
ncbi:MAG TPA: hypothetical protein VGG48_01710 [Rhizomicrobium sp.]|jgi:hypothetical protein